MANSSSNMKIGQLLKQANLVSSSQIEVALFDRNRYINSQVNKLRFGEILVLRGWIKKQTVDFFAERWEELIARSEKKRIGFYLHEAGLLDKKQIAWILQQQSKTQTINRFGEIACQNGWIKPQTVEFFVKNLALESNTPDINNLMPAIGVKEVLTRYLEGNMDLRNARLDCVDFSYMVLEKANLECASMRQAYLKHCVFNKTNLTRGNLESANLERASLARANLTEANLTKANLANVRLTNAILQGADLRGANLTNTNLQKATYDRFTQFDRDVNPRELGMELVGVEPFVRKTQEQKLINLSLENPIRTQQPTVILF